MFKLIVAFLVQALIMAAAWAALSVVGTLLFNLISGAFHGPSLEYAVSLIAAEKIAGVLIALYGLFYLLLVIAAASVAAKPSYSRIGRR